MKEKIFKNFKTIRIAAYLILVVVALSILPKMKDYLIERFAYIDVKVASDTMAPYIVSGTSGRTFIFEKEYERGDLVIFEDSDEAGNTVNHIYRIIGLPNEYVEMVDDMLMINGEVVEEKWLNQDYVNQIKAEYGYFTTDFAIQLYDLEYYVLGDNRIYSEAMDSRSIGAVSNNRFKGTKLITDDGIIE